MQQFIPCCLRRLVAEPPGIKAPWLKRGVDGSEDGIILVLGRQETLSKQQHQTRAAQAPEQKL
jgi:hypothetical protein